MLPRPPRPLAALMAASFVLAVAWALLVPPFHAPDEDEHYVYIQSLAENLSLPPYHGYNKPGVQLSPTVRTAERYARTRSYWLVELDSSRPPWDSAAERRYAAVIRAHPPPTARVDSAAYQGSDPPLYHAYAALAYRLTPGDNVFTRLFWMRVWTALLILATVAGAWLLAGEVVGPRRTLQLVAAGCVGLQPMVTFMSGGVNPDAGAYAAGAFVLWLGVRVIRHGPTRSGVVGLAASVVVAALVKTAMVTLAPAAVVAVLVALNRAGRWPERARRLAIPIAIGIVVGAILVAVALTPAFLPKSSRLSGFLSYLWQYYLPDLPWQKHIHSLPAHPYYSVWLRGGWGVFGSSDVHLPAMAYRVLAAVSIGTFAAAGLALFRKLVSIDRAVLAFFGLAVVGLVLGLHIADYGLITRFGAGTVQGRYLLPLLPIAGTAVAVALLNLRRTWRPPAAALVLSSMLALNLLSLGLVAGRFYA